jgi:hypothetical protein
MTNYRHQLTAIGEAADAEIRVLTEQLRIANERSIGLQLKLDKVLAELEMCRSQANSTAQRV